MNMETLKGKLENISFSWNDEGKLTGEFANLRHSLYPEVI